VTAKTHHNRAFYKYHIYNVPSQMYALAKFQTDMPIILGVMALQSGNNKKMDLYSKHWENKLQTLTKMDITYEWNVTWSCNLHDPVRHEQARVSILGTFFPPSPRMYVHAYIHACIHTAIVYTYCRIVSVRWTTVKACC